MAEFQFEPLLSLKLKTNKNTFKGPVRLIKRVKIAHSFLVCVKSVPLYQFKLAYVVL